MGSKKLQKKKPNIYDWTYKPTNTSKWLFSL